jgi:hypothetical protein
MENPSNCEKVYQNLLRTQRMSTDATTINDDLVKSPVSHEVTEITKRILNIFNVPFFVALWLREKILVLTTESILLFRARRVKRHAASHGSIGSDHIPVR